MQEGNPSSTYRGESPPSGEAYINRYQTDTFVIKEGRILEVYGGGRVCQVTYGSGVNNAIWLGQMEMGLTGSADSSIPCIGSRVAVLQPNAGLALILGCLPFEGFGENGVFYQVEKTSVDSESLPQHKILTDNPEEELSYFGDGKANDVLPGEFAKQNDLGNFISLLRGIAIIKATDMSQIQLHAIDGLTRIVSQTFEHISKGFETKSYSKEKKMSTETIYFAEQKERYGKDGAIAQVDDETELAQELDTIRPYPRLQMFTGDTGDLVHIAARSELPENFDVEDIGGEVEAEQASIKIDKDCRLEMRSSEEIVLSYKNVQSYPERTKKYHEEDAPSEGQESSEGEVEEEVLPFEYTEGDLTEQENERERYNERIYGNRNKDNSEFSLSLSRKESEEEDNSTQVIIGKDRVLLKAGNSHIELRDGRMEISVEKDILVRSGNGTALLVGENLSLRARQGVEVASTESSIKTKSHLDTYMYSKERGIVLESEAQGFFEDAPAGIQLKTAEGASIILNSANDIGMYADQTIAGLASSRIQWDATNVSINAGGGSSKVSYSPSGVFVDAGRHIINANQIRASFNRMVYAGQDFRLSGNSRGKIYGGARGTRINLIIQGRELEYARERDGGRYVRRIEKATSPEQTSPLDLELPSTDGLLAPFTKANSDTQEFNWTAYTAPFSEEIIERAWQRESESGVTWNLDDDEVNGTRPFPGPEYLLYKSYEPASEIGNEPEQKGGEFKEAPTSNYKL